MHICLVNNMVLMALTTQTFFGKVAVAGRPECWNGTRLIYITVISRCAIEISGIFIARVGVGVQCALNRH